MTSYAFTRRTVVEEIIHVRAESSRSARILAEGTHDDAVSSRSKKTTLKRAPELDRD